MSEETRTGFHESLASVTDQLVQMAAYVTEGVGRTTEALLALDIAAADQIITSDDELDLLSLEVEEATIQMLALESPVAADLRRLVTDLKLNSEIERSGDLVTNIAKAIGRLQGIELEPVLRGLLTQMCEQCVRLFGHAMDAYVEQDLGVARMLPELDDRLDELHDEYIQNIFDSRSRHILNTQQALQLAVIGRFYERIGDHAVNIAERVTYLVTGEMPEHAGAMRAKARREAAEAQD